MCQRLRDSATCTRAGGARSASALSRSSPFAMLRQLYSSYVEDHVEAVPASQQESSTPSC